jgi:ATP-binding cassette subfamily B protein
MTDRGRRQLVTAMILSAVSGLFEGLALLALLPLVTALVTGSAYGLGFGAWLWVLAALAVLGGIVRYLDTLTGYRAAGDMIRSAHLRLGDRLSQLPIGWFEPRRTGELSRLVTSGFMDVGTALAHMLTTLVRQLGAVVTVGVGIWFWDWRLGLVFLVSTPLAILVLWAGARVAAVAHRVQAPSTDELSARIVEYAACQPALRASGRSQDFEPLRTACRDNDRARFKELWLQTASLLLSATVLQGVVVALIAVTVALATSSLLSAASAVTFVGLALRFSGNLKGVGEGVTGMQATVPPIRRVVEIMATPALSAPSHSAPLPHPGAAELDQVGFGYRADAPVLDGVSLAASPATMTAIVGPSGAGKTTIARLIARFWEADSGTVAVSGTPVRDQPTAQLMEQLSMVFQDVYLFDDTLEANIRIGRPQATDEELRHAADLSGVTEIVDRLPEGWGARVGEAGRSLSGGERQRVSIARALLKRAPIVLFDEATSALDAENEQNVLASIDALRADATFVVIAHKLSTIARADRIIVLGADGRVTETGSHDELYAANGAYRRFWEHREQAAGWRLTLA